MGRSGRVVGRWGVGTSIRWFDPSTGEWTVIWLAPQANVVPSVRGGAVGGRIVLHGERQDGSLRRWSFNDIEPDSFVWRGERSPNRGATWILEAEYDMRRHGRDEARRGG